MHEKDLARAFGTDDKSKWTESQRRIVWQLEYSEKTIKTLQGELANYKEAAALAWLQHMNQKPAPYNPSEDDE